MLVGGGFRTLSIYLFGQRQKVGQVTAVIVVIYFAAMWLATLVVLSVLRPAEGSPRELRGVMRGLREVLWRETRACSPMWILDVAEGSDVHPARPFRLREDHATALDRRPGPPRPRDSARSPGRDVTSALVPEARGIAMTFQNYAAVPQHDRPSESRFRPATEATLAFRTDRAKGGCGARDDGASVPAPMPGPMRSRAGRSSVWPWPARWCWSRGFCCSTSRCRRWTRRSASACATS